MSDTDKIAHLPAFIREEVNERLLKQEPYGDILKWLDSLPDVWRVLAKHFNRENIFDHDIREWRDGGFAAWKLRREVAGDLPKSPPTAPASNLASTSRVLDQLHEIVAGHFVKLLHNWNGEVTWEFEAKLRVLSHLTRDVCALRQAALHAARLQLEEKKLAFRQKQADDQKQARFRQWLDHPGIRQRVHAHYHIKSVEQPSVPAPSNFRPETLDFRPSSPSPTPDARPKTPDPSLPGSESHQIKPNQGIRRRQAAE